MWSSLSRHGLLRAKVEETNAKGFHFSPYLALVLSSCTCARLMSLKIYSLPEQDHYISICPCWDKNKVNVSQVRWSQWAKRKNIINRKSLSHTYASQSCTPWEDLEFWDQKEQIKRKEGKNKSNNKHPFFTAVDIFRFLLMHSRGEDK